MLRRVLGRTGVELSVVGFGGLLVAGLPQAEADRMVADAVDCGVSYFDVAPTYGNAQERLGPALAPYRRDCFLACKTAERTAERATAELEGSLRALHTHHLDLYQLHGLASLEDVAQAFGPGGAMETLVQGKQEGKIRLLGFSAHSTEAALEALSRYPFDSVLFPINFACWHHRHFGPEVVQAAERAGAGRLALKALAHHRYPEGAPRYDKTWYQPIEDPELAALALRWTLSQGVTAALPPGEPKFFRRAVEIAKRFSPITPEEEAYLKAAASELRPIFPQ